MSLQVYSGAFDMAIGALIATDPQRHEAVDFTYTPYPVEFILMAPYPQ